VSARQWRRLLLRHVHASPALLGLMAQTALASDSARPVDLVALRGVDASIVQDMRYAGANNFVGRPLPGYASAECLLSRPAAEALVRVQRDLAPQKLSLKVLDCYRPPEAVAAMAQWARDGRPAGAGQRFFPRLDKSALFALGYIAARSSHSLGTAVDLTLVAAGRTAAPAAAAPAVPNAAPVVPCTAPYAERGAADGIDMGTAFDCFDPRSHTANPQISAEQKQHRQLLVAAMRRHGFVNYAREWWHFSWQGP
jgi:zinc D-Ala-D-Ala dipeptidase